MRTTTYVSLLGAAVLAAVAGCTVKDVDQPALAGPSTFANAITMVADRDTLTQNGADFTDIRITALGPDGQSINLPLRAQIFVDGIPSDFGMLSTKTPTTPTTIRYTAPPAGAGGQVASTVTLVVTPSNAGDFRGEMPRQLDIQLLPQGIILPSNPNLVAAFTFTPATPRILDTVTFDASTSANGGSACGANCTYVWNFGDGTTGVGVVVTHQFRAVGTYPVTLTVTDQRGAQATATRPVPVGAGAPPTVVFTTSPANPAPGTNIFFNASESKAAEGRVLVEYFWDFGDGTTATGAAVSHSYANAGSYVVTLKVTDDARTFAVISQAITVAVPAP
jgi:PKD repeat protein